MCLMEVLRVVLDEHGVMPSILKLNLDNAATGKNALLLAFFGLLVFYNCFDEAHLRFLLADHAHDIYDTFAAITAKLLTRTQREDQRERDRERERERAGIRACRAHPIKQERLGFLPVVSGSNKRSRG